MSASTSPEKVRPTVVGIAPLANWPTHRDPTNRGIRRVSMECVGQSFLNYEKRLFKRRALLHLSSFGASTDDGDDDHEDEDKNEGTETNGGETRERNLFDLTPHELSSLTHYQILNDIPIHSTYEQIKRAYRRACLKYHPDKTGRGEDDEVFLAVKMAFDTLGDVAKRKSYDSTIDFDDSIPRGNERPDEFYDAYGPVFERNLRFDSRYDPEKQPCMTTTTTTTTADGDKSTTGGAGAGVKKRRKNRGRGGGAGVVDNDTPPPTLGDDSTPIEQVHAFYDYWTHFDSWRDFTLRAAELTEHDVETADSRDEKRWMAKEIDKKAKAMKREEMARIALLVERAMAADPRIKRERDRERAEKKRSEEERMERRARAEREKAEREERIKREQEEKERKEKEIRAAEKAKKEQERKILRKARQSLRRLVFAAYEQDATTNIWKDMDSMNDDVELLCSKLNAEELTLLTDVLGGPDAETTGNNPDIQGLANIRQRAIQTREGLTKKKKEEAKKRNQLRQEAAKKEAEAKAARASRPWSREELSALAKAVRKYPPGGANRWDQIALFVNNLCKPDEPRSKEECIEKYNQVAQGGTGTTPTLLQTQTSNVSSGDGTSAAAAAAAGGKSGVQAASSDVWTEEQDKQLQAGLATYPSSMDKNERWTAIAKGVTGKTKKECVQRFKAIREAIKKK